MVEGPWWEKGVATPVAGVVFGMTPATGDPDRSDGHEDLDENWITLTVREAGDYRSHRGTNDAVSTKMLDAIRATNGAGTVAGASVPSTTAHDVKVRRVIGQLARCSSSSP